MEKIMEIKSILIKDTTREERIRIVQEGLNQCGGACGRIHRQRRGGVRRLRSGAGRDVSGLHRRREGTARDQ